MKTSLNSISSIMSNCNEPSKETAGNLMYIILILFVSSSVMAALPHILKKKTE